MVEGGNALLDFLEDGGTLTIEFDPPASVAMTDLMDLKRSKLTPEDVGFRARQD